MSRLDGKHTPLTAIADLAAADGKLLAASAWAQGRGPTTMPKAGHAPDGRPLHELRPDELLALSGPGPGDPAQDYRS